MIWVSGLRQADRVPAFQFPTLTTPRCVVRAAEVDTHEHRLPLASPGAMMRLTEAEFRTEDPLAEEGA